MIASYIAIHIVLYKFFNGADKEDLSNNQKLLAFVIISFILMTLMCTSGVILLGERRYLWG